MPVIHYFFDLWEESQQPDEDATLICTECGNTCLGEDSTQEIKCCDCWPVVHHLQDGTVCNDCITDDDPDKGVSVTVATDAYPDGFTCQRCGDAFLPGSKKGKRPCPQGT